MDVILNYDIILSGGLIDLSQIYKYIVEPVKFVLDGQARTIAHI